LQPEFVKASNLSCLLVAAQRTAKTLIRQLSASFQVLHEMARFAILRIIIGEFVACVPGEGLCI
jgi:hypothetical protein